MDYEAINKITSVTMYPQAIMARNWDDDSVEEDGSDMAFDHYILIGECYNHDSERVYIAVGLEPTEWPRQDDGHWAFLYGDVWHSNYRAGTEEQLRERAIRRVMTRRKIKQEEAERLLKAVQ